MNGYADHFLYRLRRDFPSVIVGRIGLDVNAVATRMGGLMKPLDTSLDNYRPKRAGRIRFNYHVSPPAYSTAKHWS